jgi:hypothetical protein
VDLLTPTAREISVTDKLEFSFKSLTLLIKILVISVFRPAYFPSFCTARIPCFCDYLRRLFSNSAIPERVVVISLLLAKSTEVGKPKAAKVTFFFKEYRVVLKTSKYFD